MTGNDNDGAALRLNQISKSFGATRVLDGVSFHAQPGEFIALVGPSGCGKSTLLRIAAGLEGCDQGEVWLDGRDVTGTRAADRDMAMVFQSYALYPHLTARQNMALPLAMRRLSAFQRMPLIGRLSRSGAGIRKDIQRDVEQAAAALRIEALLDRKPKQLSGGQRQRVALGRALVRHPRAFLMDEPLSNLDAALRVHMRNEIVDLHRKAGVVTVYVTHDQEEALGMADRVAVMLGGRIVQMATPAQIYSEPAHVDVAKFIGSPAINLIPVVIDGQGSAVLQGASGPSVLAANLALAAGTRVTFGIRPENLELRTERQGFGLPVRLDRVEFLGAEAHVHCRADGLDTSLIARGSPAMAAQFANAPELFASARGGVALLFDAEGKRIVPQSAVAEAASHAA
jgi:multiple sugar transport system ATP-binding protein